MPTLEEIFGSSPAEREPLESIFSQPENRPPLEGIFELTPEPAPSTPAVIRPTTLRDRLRNLSPAYFGRAALQSAESMFGLGAMGGSLPAIVGERVVKAVAPESVEEQLSAPFRKVKEGLMGYALGQFGEEHEAHQQLREKLAYEDYHPITRIGADLAAYMADPLSIYGGVKAVAKMGSLPLLRHMVKKATTEVADVGARELAEAAAERTPAGTFLAPQSTETAATAISAADDILKSEAKALRSAANLGKKQQKLLPQMTETNLDAAREARKNIKSGIAGDLAEDVAKVQADGTSAALLSAKHRLVSASQYDASFVSSVAENADRARFANNKEVMQDLVGLIEGTGNPWRGADDALSNVVERLKAGGVWDEAREYVRNFRAEARALLAERNAIVIDELGGEELKAIPNYLHHEWESYRPFRGRPEAVATTATVEKKRTYKSVFEAIHQGGEVPRFDDAVSMVARTRQIYARTLATKKFMSDLVDIQNKFGGRFIVRGEGAANRVAKLQAGSKEPKPWKPITSRFLNVLIPGSDQMYVHPEMYKALRHAIVGDERAWFDTTNSILKNVHFLFSFFHRGALAESNILSTNLIRGLALSARQGFGIPGISHGLRRAGVARHTGEDIVGTVLVRGQEARVAKEIETGTAWTKIEDERITSLVPGEGTVYADPAIGEHVNAILRANVPADPKDMYEYLGGARAAHAGVTIDRPLADTQLALHDDAVREARNRLKQRGDIGSAAADKALKFYEKGKQWMDESLWQHMHHSSKIYVFNHLSDMALKAKHGGPGFRPLKSIAQAIGPGKIKNKTDTEILRSVAKYVNDEFGGQNWALHTGRIMEILSDPSVQRGLRNLYISPDWNISSFRATWAPISPDPVRRWLGARHWFNNWFGVYVHANMVNKALSGHYMWENEIGKTGHIDTGEPGPGRFLRILKQEKDAFRPFQDPVATLTTKLTPQMQMVADFITKGRKPWTKPGFYETLEMIEEALLPFSVSGIERAGLMGAVFPGSAGMLPQEKMFAGGPELREPYQAQERLDEAIAEGDSDTIRSVLAALKDNGMSDADLSAVLERAIGRALRRAKKEQEAN